MKMYIATKNATAPLLIFVTPRGPGIVNFRGLYGWAYILKEDVLL